MKISLEWINEYVDLRGIDLNWLVNKLNIITAKVDSIITFGEDTILNIDNKSIMNRQDLWCHYGMAREISVITGRELKDIDYINEGYLKSVSANKLNIELVDSSRCLRRSAIEVSHLVVEPSPEVISNKLVSCGIKPVNVIVDLANYVALDIGQKINLYGDSEKTVIEAVVLEGSSKDTSLTAVAICRYVRLLQEYMYEAEVTSALYDKVSSDIKPINISVEHKYIEEFIGETIDKKVVTEILRSLMFLVYELEESYSIGIPSFRIASGMSTKEAVVKELIRILGYERNNYRILCDIV